MSDERVFAAPWQAHAVALVIGLQDAGVITASEWTDALGRHRRADQAAPEYYDDWVSALGELLAAKQIITRDEVATVTASWQRAAHATPHGRPIELANDPEREPR